MAINKIFEKNNNEIFDGETIWIVIDGQYDWANKEKGGVGFIYRNFIGATGTRGEALQQAYRKMNFIGGNFKLNNEDKNSIEYIGEDRNYRIVVCKYNLRGQSVFDCNH